MIQNQNDAIVSAPSNNFGLFAESSTEFAPKIYLIRSSKRSIIFKIENDEVPIEVPKIIKSLKKIDKISTVYTVDIEKIKSKNNLIFKYNANKKKTKIVATLGPACSSKEVIKKMIDAGVNVFRINFSHADYTDVKERIDIIRELNDEYGYTTAILADLQGPKLRVGVMKEDVVVNPGDIITFQTAEDVPGTKERVYMNYLSFPQDVNPGERILLDDGKLIFEALETNGTTEVVCKVIQGGPLKSKKESTCRKPKCLCLP